MSIKTNWQISNGIGDTFDWGDKTYKVAQLSEDWVEATCNEGKYWTFSKQYLDATCFGHVDKTATKAVWDALGVHNWIPKK